MVAPSTGTSFGAACECLIRNTARHFVFGQLDLIVAQLVFTLWLEKGLLFSLRLAVKQTVCGSWLFYLFLVQTRAYHFGEALVHGRGSYVATGRGYSLEPGRFVDLYKQYAQVAHSFSRASYSSSDFWLVLALAEPLLSRHRDIAHQHRVLRLYCLEFWRMECHALRLIAFVRTDAIQSTGEFWAQSHLVMAA